MLSAHCLLWPHHPLLRQDDDDDITVCMYSIACLYFTATRRTYRVTPSKVNTQRFSLKALTFRKIHAVVPVNRQ